MRRALTLLLLVAGAALLVAAVVAGVQTASYVARAESTTGRVVGVERRQAGGSRSEVSLFPVVEFRPDDGPPRRFRGEGSGARDFRVGDEVDLLYLTDPPRDPRITGVAAVWSRAAGLLFAGVLLLLAGLLGRSMLAERQPDEDDDG